MLLVDTFRSEFQTRCVGWSLVEFSRYDPTHLSGFTPTGRAFTLDVVMTTAPDGLPRDSDAVTATLTIAGRVRTATGTRVQIEDGAATVTTLINTRNLYPANQR